MRYRKKIIYFYLVIGLFVVAPFTLSYTDVDNAEIFDAAVLPTGIASFSSLVRWFILGIMAINTIFLLKKNIKNISKPLLFFCLFYLVQLVYAVIDGFDIERFFLMTTLSLLIPMHLSISFRQFGKKLINIFTYCIFAFIILAIALNGKQVLQGQRFFGFIGNSNLYGMTAVFWAVILILKLKLESSKKNILVNVFLVIVILTVILSGSRSGVIGVLIVLATSFFGNMKRSVIFLLVFIIGFLTLSYFVNITFIEDRFSNISNSAKESGRDELWHSAYNAISQNLYTGNGMNANIIISNTGNMHNSYIRFLLNMGLVFTVLALANYFLSIFNIIRNYKKIPLILAAFLVAYSLASYGEDYFVGLGSSMFIYILIIYGLINYFLKFNEQNGRVGRRSNLNNSNTRKMVTNNDIN